MRRPLPSHRGEPARDGGRGEQPPLASFGKEPPLLLTGTTTTIGDGEGPFSRADDDGWVMHEAVEEPPFTALTAVIVVGDAGTMVALVGGGGGGGCGGCCKAAGGGDDSPALSVGDGETEGCRRLASRPASGSDWVEDAFGATDTVVAVIDRQAGSAGGRLPVGWGGGDANISTVVASSGLRRSSFFSGFMTISDFSGKLFRRSIS